MTHPHSCRFIWGLKVVITSCLSWNCILRNFRFVDLKMDPLHCLILMYRKGFLHLDQIVSSFVVFLSVWIIKINEYLWSFAAIRIIVHLWCIYLMSSFFCILLHLKFLRHIAKLFSQVLCWFPALLKVTFFPYRTFISITWMRFQ